MKNLSLKQTLASILIMATLVCTGLLWGSQVSAAITGLWKNNDTGYSKMYTFMSATSSVGFATSTNKVDPNDSGYFDIKGAKFVDFFFSRGDTSGKGNTGSSNFSVQVTPDGVNWFNYNKLVQNVSSTTYPATISSVTVAAGTSTTIVSLDLRTDAFYGVRVISQQVTDGESTSKAFAQF